MGCVRGLVALGVAGLLALGGCRAALADSLWNGDMREFVRGGADPDTFLFFSGFDIWRNGYSVHGGLLWAPQGLTENGFMVKLLTAAGTYRYRSGGVDVRGYYGLAAPMAGFRIAQNGFEVRMFAGPDIQVHRLSVFDFKNKLQGTLTGLRVNVETWWQPTELLMLAASASASTIGNNYGARAAVGWRLLDSFFAGPEAEVFSDFHYTQYRAGVHVTALRTGAFEWSLGGGYVVDNNNRSGVYGRFGVLTKY